MEGLVLSLCIGVLAVLLRVLPHNFANRRTALPHSLCLARVEIIVSAAVRAGMSKNGLTPSWMVWYESCDIVSDTVGHKPAVIFGCA